MTATMNLFNSPSEINQAETIKFPWRMRPSGQPQPGFMVRVLQHDGRWLVVSRKHSWDFRTRRAAQAFARDVADGFGVGLLVQIGGAA